MLNMLSQIYYFIHFSFTEYLFNSTTYKYYKDMLQSLKTNYWHNQNAI